MIGIRPDSCEYYKLIALYRRTLITHEAIPPELLRAIATGALDACETILQTFDAYRSVIEEALEQNAANAAKGDK